MEERTALDVQSVATRQRVDGCAALPVDSMGQQWWETKRATSPMTVTSSSGQWKNGEWQMALQGAGSIDDHET